MRIKIEAEQLNVEITRSELLVRVGRGRIWTEIRRASFLAERNIKIRMPIDTGRARASWGHSGGVAKPEDGIWQEDEPGLSLTQGSRVEYVEQLNSGSSQQAPAGFIDAEAKRAETALEEALANELMKAISGT